MDKTLSGAPSNELIETLHERFKANPKRHPGINWEEVVSKLTPQVLWSLYQMEETGGEPDLVMLEKGKISFVDCSLESPKGRRSLCYDRAALDARKEHKPTNSIKDMATEMGIEVLTEEQYRLLQQYGPFDTKTSSWVETPAPIRKLGGAIFCDHRYGAVFTYHNGADSYYAARGFRGILFV